MSGSIKQMSKNLIFPSERIHWELSEYRTSPVPEVCNYSWQLLENWNYPKNFGSYWRLYWNNKEGARILWQNQIWNMTSKEVFLIPSHIATSTELISPVAHFSINFKIGGQYDKLRRKIYTFPPDFLRSALRHFQKITDENARLMTIESIVCHYLSRLTPEDFLEQDRGDLDPRIAKVVTFMESHLSEHFSNGELCQKIGMSRNNFYRLFLQETQKTPKYFLLEQRMLRASSLLRNSEKTIEEIAQETGYADRYHFSKAFRNFYNLSPIRYRKKKGFPLPRCVSPETPSAGKKLPEEK